MTHQIWQNTRYRRRSVTAISALIVLFTALGGWGHEGLADDKLPVDYSVSHHLASLEKVTDVLADRTDGNYSWIKAVYGRVLKLGRGSGAIWFLGPDNQRGVVLSARHVVQDERVTAGVGLPRFLDYPGPDSRANFLAHLPMKNGATASGVVNEVWRILSTAIPFEIYQKQYRTILPKDDFVLGLLTTVQHPDEETLETTSTSSKIQLYDSGKWAVNQNHLKPRAEPGTPVLAIGYPASYEFQDQMTFSVGTILSSSDADALIKKSGSNAAFDPKIELVAVGRTVEGMSGGPVFDRMGALVGIVIRGSNIPVNGHYYFRILRTDYISKLFLAGFTDLPDSRQGPFKALDWLLSLLRSTRSVE